MVVAHQEPNRGPMTRAEYEAYWIVNLPEQVVEVHKQPGAEGYAAASRHGRGEKLPLASFEDIALGVDEILPPTRRP